MKLPFVKFPFVEFPFVTGIPQAIIVGCVLIAFATGARAQGGIAATENLKPGGEELREGSRKALLAGDLPASRRLFDQWIAQAHIDVQDDVLPLVDEAKWRADQGRSDEAIPILQRAYAVPAAEGAHPPSMMMAPRDFHDYIAWTLGDCQAALGQWQEAFFSYGNTHPDDGCVFTGTSIQLLALSKGNCLEHLNRTAEAVPLYWQAACYLDSSVAPLAARHLVDLYSAAGQLPALQALARSGDREIIQNTALIHSGESDVSKLTVEQQESLQRYLQGTSLHVFDIVSPFREMKRKKQFSKLIEELLAPNLPGEQEDLGRRRKMEAVAALGESGPAAAPSLERALKQHPENLFLRAALYIIRNDSESVRKIAVGLTGETNETRGLSDVLKGAVGRSQITFNFPAAPRGEKLPAELPNPFLS